MNIKILDSWLKEYVKTDASPKQIAEKLSLSSVSVERIEKYDNDFLYDIEITTNRPDLMSVIGLAREAAAVLKQNGIHAQFVLPKLEVPKKIQNQTSLHIKNDPRIVNRVCAVVMEVNVRQSPKHIQERLEASGIRSLNNLIDITNYVMRVVGHPAHVFDYDRLGGDTLTIRESRKGEKIVTLDNKEHTLPGGDIVAENAKGEIADLFGIMGVANSIVTDETKRIVFFLDNNEPYHIRKTSMSLAIRTEAAVLNEKGIDPELAFDALLYGIKLNRELADAKILSPIVDIYPNKIYKPTITISQQKIQTVIGVDIPLKKSAEILSGLDFETTVKEDNLIVTPPSFRVNDIQIPQDIIEEMARIYGYHNIPSALPPQQIQEFVHLEKNTFYWENRAKQALKYWGFTEVYTYPMVSEELFEGPIEQAVTIQNPLSEDMVYMRRTLVPSLLQVVKENKGHETIRIFEIANVYIKKQHDLPDEVLKLAGVIKKPHASFYEAKGIIEQLCKDLEIETIMYKPLEKGGLGATVFVSAHPLGEIEVLDDQTVNFELNFQLMLQYATLKKIYKPVSKYPPVVEDLAIIAPENVLTGDIIEIIKKQSILITDVSLLDKYQQTRTFHIVYQSYEKNLTDEEVGEIRKKILKVLKEKFGARLKEV